MHIQAQRPAVTITPYKTSDGRGYFTPKSVWIEDGEGSVIDERSDPRESFAGHVRATQWDQLQRHWYNMRCEGGVAPGFSRSPLPS
jgi:hypothetical protein